MSMNERQRRALDRNLVKFSDELDLVQVLPYLQQHGILRDHHIDSVNSHPTRIESRQELIRLIKCRGAVAFQVFVEALRHSGQEHLADVLSAELHSADPVQPPHHLRLQDNRPPTPETEDDDDILPPPAYRTIMEPTHEAIEYNNQFYGRKLKALGGVGGMYLSKVPQTEGVMNIVVETVDGLPARFNETDTYPNFSKPKGLAIIFNNRKFNYESGLCERLGTDVDATNMYRLLKGLGYEVKIKQNLSAEDMYSAMGRFSLKPKHKTCHSAVIVVLSHGEQGEVYGSDGNFIQLDNFIGMLNAHNCPALRDKPKLFFIQACRGKDYDSGVFHDSVDAAGGDVIRNGHGHAATDSLTQAQIVQKMITQDFVDAGEVQAKIPADADMVIAYATTPGFVSWRNSMHGSWFIQCICQTFAQHSREMSLPEMLIKISLLLCHGFGNVSIFAMSPYFIYGNVNRMVAEKLSSTGHVQISDHSIRLRRNFYFFPGHFT